MITLQGAIEKSPILLSQYLEFKGLDGTIIISYFGGRNNINADCKPPRRGFNFSFTVGENFIGPNKKRNKFWCTICPFF